MPNTVLQDTLSKGSPDLTEIKADVILLFTFLFPTIPGSRKREAEN